jgi:hypothetical protein
LEQLKLDIKNIYIHHIVLLFWLKPTNNCNLVKEEIMLSKEQTKLYTDFYDSARYNKVLEPKTTLMIHLASAMALGCYP